MMRHALSAEASAEAAAGLSALVMALACVVIAGAIVWAQEAMPPAAGEYGRAQKLEVQQFDNRQIRFEYPKKDWEIVPRPTTAVIPGATAPIVSVVQRKREAAVVVEQTKLHQPLALDDITDLFSQLESDSIRERQPQATDVRAKLVDVGGGRRLAILTYGRQGVGGPERVRQYSIPAGADLFRLTCVATVGQFGRYEAVFAHVAASFAVASGGTQ
jgi:hypothetical protein